MEGTQISEDAENLPRLSERNRATRNNQRLMAFLAMLSYKLTLDVMYYFLISRLWRSQGFTLNVSIAKLIESYLLFLIVYAAMPKSFRKLSDVMMWLLIVLSYVPMLTIYAFKSESRIYMYAATSFWLGVNLLMRSVNMSVLPAKARKIVRNPLFVVVSLAAILILGMAYWRSGFFLNLSLAGVYEIRSNYVGMNIPLSGYLINWQSYVVNPILFAIFFVRRKWIGVILIIVIQMCLFSVTGNKSFLFALPFVFSLIWVIRRKNPLAVIAGGLVVLLLLGALSYWLLEDLWLHSLVNRRTLMLPANLSFMYNDFFSKHEYVYLSDSIFRFFLDYPYELSPPNLIGYTYFGSPETNANTGVIGNAFMNFGFAGLVIFGLLLVLILKVMDALARGKDARIAIAAVTMSAFVLVNSALLTCLLTHGLLLALVIMYFLPDTDTTP